MNDTDAPSMKQAREHFADIEQFIAARAVAGELPKPGWVETYRLREAEWKSAVAANRAAIAALVGEHAQETCG